jgi:hypothetical protein
LETNDDEDVKDIEQFLNELVNDPNKQKLTTPSRIRIATELDTYTRENRDKTTYKVRYNEKIYNLSIPNALRPPSRRRPFHKSVRAESSGAGSSSQGDVVDAVDVEKAIVKHPFKIQRTSSQPSVSQQKTAGDYANDEVNNLIPELKPPGT